MMLWDQWKKGFDLWEQRTAEMMETVLKSPAVLQPMGNLLSASMKMKANVEKASAEWWGSLGLPSKRDQEKTLHALNQIQSRLIDLEEKLAALKKN
ncbi:MAG: poly(R)-hydroxyalkanoic acid synthase subunit PhaE [Archangium sp.]|nr:poly(R)-hydroxyalkanoic acid synthase subunit PhaE [Archangium sp.]MDP3157826.1 poly(R)-hydroxyalkanoic acid synthase subunit PhaE [Archangium sp.]MDP3576345.1 poly(R)-hydroxyalkanoic acid synthase subunit PhaE [Archangium sp.]